MCRRKGCGDREGETCSRGCPPSLPGVWVLPEYAPTKEILLFHIPDSGQRVGLKVDSFSLGAGGDPVSSCPSARLWGLLPLVQAAGAGHGVQAVKNQEHARMLSCFSHI